MDSWIDSGRVGDVQFLARAVPAGFGADKRCHYHSCQRLSPPEPIADYCMGTTAIGFARTLKANECILSGIKHTRCLLVSMLHYGSRKSRKQGKEKMGLTWTGAVPCSTSWVRLTVISNLTLDQWISQVSIKPFQLYLPARREGERWPASG